MTAQEKRWTVNAIKDALRAAGSHWFDPDTMRCFGTQVLPSVYQGPGGVYFVTRDNQYDSALPKRYTVRRFEPEGPEVSTAGELCGFRTKEQAQANAKDRAAHFSNLIVPPSQGGFPTFRENVEDFKPVSVLEQFLHDLHQHGKPEARESYAKDLIRGAGRHHKMMEAYCNGAEIYDAQGNPLAALAALRGMLTNLASAVGATAVLFSGDPRGCTVKLTFADGFTNDFAHEGYCVPTSLTGD